MSCNGHSNDIKSVGSGTAELNKWRIGVYPIIGKLGTKAKTKEFNGIYSDDEDKGFSFKYLKVAEAKEV
jgi:hypothetical protein